MSESIRIYDMFGRLVLETPPAVNLGLAFSDDIDHAQYWFEVESGYTEDMVLLGWAEAVVKRNL